MPYAMASKRRLIALTSGVLIACSSGGSDGGTVTTPTPVASVNVSPTATTILLGASGTLIASVRDAHGSELTGRSVTWSSANPTVASVSNSGLVTGVAVGGPVTITATSEGVNGSASVTITTTAPPVATLTVTPPLDTVQIGLVDSLAATLTDANGHAVVGPTLTWSSSNPAIATVSMNGMVTGIGAGGPVTITATSGTTHGSSNIVVTSTKNPVAQQFAVNDSAETAFFRFAAQANGDPRQAIVLTANWLATQPGVASAVTLDSTFIEIALTSGINTVFRFNDQDDSGLSVSRGGGARGGGVLTRFALRPLQTITNKKVLICAPAYSQFYQPGEIERIVADFTADSKLGLVVTLLKDAQCPWQSVSTFQDYGLVILDTHGGPAWFLAGGGFTNFDSRRTAAELKADIDNEAGFGTYDRIIAGDLDVGDGITIKSTQTGWYNNNPFSRGAEILVTTKYLASLSPLSGTIIMGNMCYSGATATDGNEGNGPGGTPMATAFMALQPISYYGYAFSNGVSHTVSDGFAKRMEDSLARAFVRDGDSTGIAHLKDDGTEYAQGTSPVLGPFSLKHWGANDWSYDICGKKLVDSRDQQEYKTVCIGNQRWMAQNLNYNAAGSMCLASCAVYGRLYDWPTLMQGAASTTNNPSGVQGICPVGWHIPSWPEVQQLFAAVGGRSVAGAAMKALTLWKAPNTGATNSSGFTALPAGYFDPHGLSGATGEITYIGSATEDAADSDLTWVLMLTYNQAFAESDNIGQDNLSGKGALISVRCVAN